MSEKRMSSEDRKCRILQAVSGLFSRKGMAATSKEISEAAGVSEALIYKHFESKEGLYSALLEKTCKAHNGVGMELAEQEPSTEVLICAVYLLVHIITTGMESEDEGFALSPEELRGLLLQSYQSDGEIARTLFKNGLSPWICYYVDAMKAAKKSGDFHDATTDYETLVWMAHHAISGIKMTLHPKPHAFMGQYKNEDELKDLTLIFVCRGIGLKNEALMKTLKSKMFKDFKNKLNSKKEKPNEVSI